MSAGARQKNAQRPGPPRALLDIAGHVGRVLEGEHFLKPQRTSNEQDFYRLVENKIPEATNTVLGALQWLRPYVPRYYGERPAANQASSSSSEDGTEEAEPLLILDNLFHPFENPAVLDLKLELSTKQVELDRTSAANLLGCYVHGVESKHICFRNGYNEYKGATKPIDHFYSTLSVFFSRCQSSEARRREVLGQLRELCDVFARLCSLGFDFPSTSMLFLYDQNEPFSLSFALIDFEHASYRGESLSHHLSHLSNLPLYDSVAAPLLSAALPFRSHPICKSSRIVHHAVRQAIFPLEFPVSVYLVRHGERHDYTDFDWAPTSPHPHDAHLSAAGQRQSEDFADRLRHLNIHRLAAAPMQRAILGAEPIARATRATIAIEPGFCEFLCSKTRTRVPSFFSHDVSITPFVDSSYKPHWPSVQLESWPDVFERSSKAVSGLVSECREGRGDLVILSHRSTLQTVFKALLPEFEDDTMLEYGGIAMISETAPGSGKFEMITFNELNHLRDRIQSPSSNPFRHIEGYYEDLSWSSYKSTADMWAQPDNNTTTDTTTTTTTTTNNNHHHQGIENNSSVEAK